VISLDRRNASDLLAPKDLGKRPWKEFQLSENRLSKKSVAVCK